MLVDVLQGGMTSADLDRKEFPPPKWIVPGLVPEGLGILVGKPKTGKSFLALNIAASVSAGSTVLGERVERRRVLYLSLEDTFRRIKQRLGMIGAIPTDRLHFYTSWGLGEKALEQLRLFLAHFQDTGLVIIDTLSRIRAPVRGDTNSYQEDYKFMTPIKTLADGKGVSILLVHHTRKQEADDWMDAASGTTGITGAADTILLLNRGRGEVDAVLSASGRDFQEREVALRFEQSKGWIAMGPAGNYRDSVERQQILKAVKDMPPDVSANELAAITGKKSNTITRQLRALEKDGKIKRVRTGRYAMKNDAEGLGTSPPHSESSFPSELEEKSEPYEGYEEESESPVFTALTSTTPQPALPPEQLN
jgi:DNA-binding transcriptional ArsR family regulator